MLGKTVYVTFAHMSGIIIGIETPYTDDPSVELYEVELDNGQIAYALQSQLR